LRKWPAAWTRWKTVTGQAPRACAGHAGGCDRSGMRHGVLRARRRGEDAGAPGGSRGDVPRDAPPGSRYGVGSWCGPPSRLTPTRLQRAQVWIGSRARPEPSDSRFWKPCRRDWRGFAGDDVPVRRGVGCGPFGTIIKPL
jgi:hypothetical protein